MLILRANLRAAQAQYELAEDAKALNEKVVNLTAELVTLTARIKDVTNGLWFLGFASLAVALVAVLVAVFK